MGSTGTDTGFAVIDRNDPFGSQPRLRSRRAGVSEYDGLSALETQRKVNANLGAGATTIYLCPLKRRARSGPGLCAVHNPSGGGITIDVHHVPSGGAAGVTNKLFPTKTVAAGETWVPLATTLWQLLAAGEAIVVNTGGAGLNLWATFLEERPQIHTGLGGFFSDPDATDRTLLTVTAGRAFALNGIHAFNRDVANRTLTVNLRTFGAAAATTNQLVSQLVNAGAEFNLATLLSPTLEEGGIVSCRGSGAGLGVWAHGVLL